MGVDEREREREKRGSGRVVVVVPTQAVDMDGFATNSTLTKSQSHLQAVVEARQKICTGVHGTDDMQLEQQCGSLIQPIPAYMRLRISGCRFSECLISIQSTYVPGSNPSGT
jgi:hypothetical protein